MVLFPVSRSDHQIITDFPVYFLNKSHLCITRLDCSIQISPRLFMYAVDVEDTKTDTNALLAKNRHSWVVFFAIHRNGKFVLIWVSLSTDLQSSIVNHNVTSIEGLLISRVIIVRWEDQGTTIDLNKSKFG